MTLLKSEDKLKVGDKAPEFSLKGVDDKMHSLSDIDGPVLIVFMCNHCPYVQGKISVLIDLQEKYNGKLTVIGINSNAANTDYPDDDFSHMKEAVEEYGINFVYLSDSDQSVSRAYGAVCTPDPFLFDSDGRLFYHGQINDVHGPSGTPTTHDMDDAISKMLEGSDLDFEVKPSMGCSIKWV